MPNTRKILIIDDDPELRGALTEQCALARKVLARRDICPCLIGHKDLMTKFYPAAVGDTANAGSDKSSS